MLQDVRKVSGRPCYNSLLTEWAQTKEAGLGGWTDAEISRAVRSGVSRSGRLLFWQGMPWDHFSNLDEEDVVSLIAYLRTMPPVGEKVPPYRPPTPDDCKIYTFWTNRNLEPGCR